MSLTKLYVSRSWRRQSVYSKIGLADAGTPSAEIVGTAFFHAELGPLALRATSFGFTGPKDQNKQMS